MALFWDVVPCSLIKMYHGFRHAYSPYHKSDDCEMGLEHKAGEWWLFTDTFKENLKTILLYKRNKEPSVHILYVY
jgi:hypothetical protein